MFPTQIGVYHGKVRDVYFLGDEKIAMVATDRISAFDVVLLRSLRAGIKSDSNILFRSNKRLSFLIGSFQVRTQWFHTVISVSLSK